MSAASARPTSYFGFVVVGIALVSIMYSCFSIPELVRQELIAGTFDRLLLSPVRRDPQRDRDDAVPAAVLVHARRAHARRLRCAMFGLQLHWSTVPLSVPAMGLALLAFLPFGLLFAALTVSIKQGDVGTSWVIALISIVGGLYFPISLLPHWVQTAAKLQPFTPATEHASAPAREQPAEHLDRDRRC